MSDPSKRRRTSAGQAEGREEVETWGLGDWEEEKSNG